jgi:CspA family cold shock protein
VRVLENPPSLQRMQRPSADDMAARIEDLIKLLDREGANLRRGRYPDAEHGRRIAALLRRVADDFDA